MNNIRAVNKRIITFIYLLFVKLFYFRQFKCGLKGTVISPFSSFDINSGKISIGNKIGIRKRCIFSVSNNGKIKIGNNCFFNVGCILTSHNDISIGDNTRFGPNVMIYDHDYKYKDVKSFRTGNHESSPIIIGKDCWIGAGSIILKGTRIGDGCVVGAGSIIKGEYSNNTLIIQKKDTKEINL